MSQNVSSAAVMIDTFRVKIIFFEKEKKNTHFQVSHFNVTSEKTVHIPIRRNKTRRLTSLHCLHAEFYSNM